MRKLLTALFILAVLAILGGAGAAALAIWHFGRGLPDHQQLANYRPAILTRVHAGDGRILAEFATERRLYVPIEVIPKRVIEAFLAAEDKSFYSHHGISVPDIVRAALTNLAQLGQNRRPVGASTITQQVAKNFLLTNEVSVERKVREALLAMRIEEALSKDQILELYLNEIYLGASAYGVAAAALYYFDKSLDDLTIAEAAFLAALPKAPNNYNPSRYPEAAKARRDWALGRMLDDGIISAAEAEAARNTPITLRSRDETVLVRADYFAEEVRREILARYGESQLYRGGLSVRTTLDPRLQAAADRSLRNGLIAYDRRHGYRGALGQIEPGLAWRERLNAMPRVPALAPWEIATVLAVTPNAAEVGFASGAKGSIPFEAMRWARKTLEDQKLGPPLRQPADALAVGDIVVVERIEGKTDDYALRQIPAIGGAIVSLDPHTGRVLAMTGGWSFEASQFNRVTQAQRQPGSAFKPFVYLAGLDSGFTPTSIILDGPVALEQGVGLGLWKPKNYGRDFLGPVPMRVGIEQSRNLMTVRLADSIGMGKVVDYARRFGIVDAMPPHLSMALGAGETTLLKLTAAYAMLVNGGLKITPTWIDRVQDRTGRTIFKQDARPCEGCLDAQWSPGLPAPQVLDLRERVVDAATAYQMVSMMQGAVERGTARRLVELRRPLAGKTGTTNDSHDTWFIGFTPDLVAGVFMGFDTPRTLGERETGSSVALPVFRDFMAEVLENRLSTPFRIPPGIRLVRVNPSNGEFARASDPKAIWEAFKPGSENSPRGPLVDGGPGVAGAVATPVPASEGGGLY